MDILFFIGGFVLGIILTAIIFTVINGKSKKTNEELSNIYKNEFENMANKIFEQNSIKLSETNKEKMDILYEKFKEKIDDFTKVNSENVKTEHEKLTRFDENIKEFIKAGGQIAQDTNNLTKIMKSDNRTQGKWGEIVLERVLESSGLRKDEEYFIQKANTTDGRPDAIIQLPENKCVAIDAKTSLASFSAYIETDNAEEKSRHLKEFIDSTKAHISGLAKRDYTPNDGNISPEYILMFIPIESCYSLMFCEDNALWDYAWKNHIMPVSPSTLLASLKIINTFLMVNRQNENAQEISRLATKMLDKFADMVKNLRGAQDKINSTLTQLDGRDSIIVNANKMTELGVKMNKPMPEIESISVEN